MALRRLIFTSPKIAVYGAPFCRWCISLFRGLFAGRRAIFFNCERVSLQARLAEGAAGSPEGDFDGFLARQNNMLSVWRLCSVNTLHRPSGVFMAASALPPGASVHFYGRIVGSEEVWTGLRGPENGFHD